METSLRCDPYGLASCPLGDLSNSSGTVASHGWMRHNVTQTTDGRTQDQLVTKEEYV